ncbi:hypothetical protein MRB53_036844 [Persea americana]|nr:hypothetical protein MRB53_036844 [Persea americana]
MQTQSVIAAQILTRLHPAKRPMCSARSVADRERVSHENDGPLREHDLKAGHVERDLNSSDHSMHGQDSIAVTRLETSMLDRVKFVNGKLIVVQPCVDEIPSIRDSLELAVKLVAVIFDRSWLTWGHCQFIHSKKSHELTIRRHEERATGPIHAELTKALSASKEEVAETMDHLKSLLDSPLVTPELEQHHDEEAEHAAITTETISTKAKKHDEEIADGAITTETSPSKFKKDDEEADDGAIMTETIRTKLEKRDEEDTKNSEEVILIRGKDQDVPDGQASVHSSGSRVKTQYDHLDLVQLIDGNAAQSAYSEHSVHFLRCTSSTRDQIPCAFSLATLDADDTSPHAYPSSYPARGSIISPQIPGAHRRDQR